MARHSAIGAIKQHNKREIIDCLVYHLDNPIECQERMRVITRDMSYHKRANQISKKESLQPKPRMLSKHEDPTSRRCENFDLIYSWGPEKEFHRNPFSSVGIVNFLSKY